MTTLLHPNNDLVATAWAKMVSGLPSGQIAGTLPEDNSTWAASGFVEVSTSGGTPTQENALRSPVITYDCWACAPGSVRPPWGKANALAEAIVAANYAHLHGPVTMPAGYGPARVLSTLLIAEPRRVGSDPAGYARFQVDIQIVWLAG